MCGAAEFPNCFLQQSPQGTGRHASVASRRAPVGGHDSLRNPVGEFRAQRAARRNMIEGGIFVEATEMDRPSNGSAVTAEAQDAALTGDGNDAEIESRCIAPDDHYLSLASSMSLFQRRIVDKRFADGALDLVDVRAGEEHRCAVGVNADDRLCAPIGPRILEDGKHVTLFSDL